MPSAAANAKLEKPVAPEASDNSPVRQVLVIIEHKIRNLEKRKSKLVSYREIQKSGKELNADQKVAVAKYDEVAQTLEFARDLYKQISIIAITAERDAKRQAKRDARALSANENNKVRDILCILDCLSCMGSEEARNDFLAGTNGAVKLTSEDLRILDDIYPEVTPKHEVVEQGLPTFQMEALKAAEHLLAIVDSRPKDVVGTTYARIKEIVNIIYQCGYFDNTGDGNQELEEPTEVPEETSLEHPDSVIVDMMAPMGLTAAPMAMTITSPALSPPTVVPTAAPVLPAPAAAAVPAPTFPMMPVAPVTLQEVEHAYFTQQYVQQPRPIAEVIGSQNFYFLQESELDSPTTTPQPPARRPSSPNAPVQSQTYTNQSFSAPQPRHFPPELRPNALIPSADIQSHFPNAAGEIPRGPPFPVSSMQINPMAIPRAPLSVPPTQAAPSAQSLPIHVALPTHTGNPYVSSVENATEAEERQPTHANSEITTDDNGWGENITVGETDEWIETDTAEDRKDRPRGDSYGDHRGDPRGDSRGLPKYRGRGRGAPRGGPPRNNYQNGRNGNSQYRNGDGYQNGGGSFRERDNNQGGGNYRERDNNQGAGNYRERDSNQGGGNYRERESNQGGANYRERDSTQGGNNYRERDSNQGGDNYRERDSNQGGGNYRERDSNQGGGNYRERDSNQGGNNYRERDNNQGGGNYRESQQGNSGYQGYKGRGRGAPVGTRGSGGRGRGVAPRGTTRSQFARKSPVRE